MTEPTENIVLFELLTPHIAQVTLNRPAKRNAISPQLASAMDAIVKKIERDPQIRVAILTSSEPRVFCAQAQIWGQWLRVGVRVWKHPAAALAASSMPKG
jgi:enoyl-CoA hydratase/carnithine racemase